MEATQTYELTPELLDNYLASFPPTAVMARRNHVYTCPIACALQAHSGVSQVGVSSNIIIGESRVDDSTTWVGYRHDKVFEIPTPAWAQKFIALVDSRRRGGIRAGTARRYLAEVMQQGALEHGTG